MILLDTPALFWLAVEPARLSPAARAAIKQALAIGGIAIAAITLAELAMIVALGRYRPTGTPEAPAIATLAVQFFGAFPGDPADRLIAATAASGPGHPRPQSASQPSEIETVW